MRAWCAAFVCALAACDRVEPIDAGTDARSPELDAGFDPSSIDPCVIDPGLAFDSAPHAGYTSLSGDPFAVRLFYPFVVLADEGSTGDLDPSRRDGLRAAAACEGADACVRAALEWTDADASAAADAVVARLETGGLTTVAAHLRSSGVCASLDADDASLVRACVRDALLQTTAALDAVLGELDDVALDTAVDAVAPDSAPFWAAADISIAALRAASRDEAVRYEPLADGENAAAIARSRTIDFSMFPFAAILVPGQGPDDPDTALHPQGRMRADMGRARWAAGLAPVIILSGGHVHPDRTPYSEAIEMKRYLVTERGVPEDAILVDPYARHTTTNLRDASRILVRAGVPADRPILVTTDVFQSGYIAGAAFATRCDDELGYRPFAGMTALSRNDGCFLPVRASLSIDASDPLDP